MASPLGGLGRAKLRVGELDAADAVLRRALAIREKAVGPAHQELAVPLLGLGELAVARATPNVAIPLLERALGLKNPKREPEIHVAFAEALALAGDHAGARAHMEAARAAFALAGNTRAASNAEARIGAL
jgi:hypothetical protein